MLIECALAGAVGDATQFTIVKVEGSKLEVKSQGTVSVEASGDIKVKGSSVAVN